MEIETTQSHGNYMENHEKWENVLEKVNKIRAAGTKNVRLLKVTTNCHNHL